MKNFCPLPWTHLFLHTTGTTKLCCVSTQRDSYLSLTNNPSFNEARLKMLKGERPEECYSYCYKTEDNGGMSKRQQQLVNPPNNQFTYQDAVNNTNADGTIKKELIYDLDLRIGNTCDLACIMCGSINSSKWAELERSINIKTGMEKPAGISKWWEDKKFWEELNEILRNAKLIKFGGGEPLLLKQHKDVLKFLKENNPNCTIKYITNANNFTQEYIDLWQDLPNLRFTLSIDSIKERVEYLRWPIKWDNLIKNIRMLKQLKRPPSISINYTISLFNILYVNDDLNWFLPRLKELGIKHFNPSHVWNDPNFLHPGLLPDEIKDTIKIDVESGTEKGWHIASNINSYLYSRSYDKELLEQFVEYAKQLDSARGTNVLETFPRLKSIISHPQI
jgi:hypothetical protein